MKNKELFYQSVYESIRNEILASKYQKGAQIPSLKEICKTYHVGRNTARSAVAMLAETGYVKPEKGSNHVVIYDINDFDYNLTYRTEIASKRNASHEILQIIGFVMPFIAVEAIHCCSKEEREELIAMITEIENDVNNNQYDLIEQLMKLYLMALRNLQNDKLIDLFKTMMNFIVIPLNVNEMSSKPYVFVMKKIKSFAMGNFKSAIQGKTFLLKRTIPIFTSLVDKGCLQFYNDFCSDIKYFEPISFQWHDDYQQRYIYTKVCVKIMQSINYHRLEKGATLPSIEGMAKTYVVSKKTIIKALEVLQEYRIVESKNGVGTIVVFDRNEDYTQTILRSPVKGYIQSYKESLQICRWIISSFRKKQFSMITHTQYDALYEELEVAFTTEAIMKMLCKSYNETLYYIYQQLSKTFVWHIFLCMAAQQEFDTIYTEARKISLRNAIKDYRMENVQSILVNILDEIIELLTNTFIRLENNEV